MQNQQSGCKFQPPSPTMDWSSTTPKTIVQMPCHVLHPFALAREDAYFTNSSVHTLFISGEIINVTLTPTQRHSGMTLHNIWMGCHQEATMAQMAVPPSTLRIKLITQAQ